MVQGEDRKERVTKRELCRSVTEEHKKQLTGRAYCEEPAGRESQSRKIRLREGQHEPAEKHSGLDRPVKRASNAHGRAKKNGRDLQDCYYRYEPCQLPP